MKDLIKKVNNSERETSMKDELKKAEAETKVDAPEGEAEVKETTEAKDSCDKETCEKKTEETEEKKTEETEDEKAEDTNAEEGEKAEDEEKAEDGGNIADKVEAKIKALQDENAQLKEEIAALKNEKASAEAKASANDELQARLTSILSMAEPAKGGEVSEKEDKKPVDTYGNALEEAFKELS